MNQAEFLVAFVTGLASGVLASVVVEIFLRPIQRGSRAITVRRNLRNMASQGVPRDFVKPTIELTVDASRIQVSVSEVVGRLGTQGTDRPIALVTGKYGSGKSYVCRYLSGQWSDSRSRWSKRVSVVVDGGDFRTSDIYREIAQQIAGSIGEDFSRSDVRRLLESPDVMLIIDGIDQLPFNSEWDGVLERIIRLANDETHRCIRLLATREEFLSVESKLANLLQSDRVVQIAPVEFDDISRREFVKLKDHDHAEDRLNMLNQLEESSVGDLLGRPMILSRFVEIPLAKMGDLFGANMTVSRLYEASFPEIQATDRAALSAFAYEAYVRDTYSLPTTSRLYAENVDGRSGLARSGVLSISSTNVVFSHATFRDYFAAEHIIARLREGRGENVLSTRVIHYMVSEFVAGLADRECVARLLELMSVDTDSTALSNAVDIMAEIEGESLRETIKRRMETMWRDVEKDGSFGSTLFLAAAAAAYGSRDGSGFVLAALERLGADEFLRMFFVTRESYKYYGGSYDRFISEALQLIQNPKFAYLRCIYCMLLGRMGVRQARETIRQIANDPNEDLFIQECASEAAVLLTREQVV